MERLLVQVLNMGITAGFAAVLVMLVRLPLRRFPKGYSYALWFVVLGRFLIPFSIPWDYSPIPVYLDALEFFSPVPAFRTGISFVDYMANRMFMDSMAVPEPNYMSIDPIQVVLYVMGIIWIGTMAVILLYHLVKYLRLKSHLSTAVRVEPGVFQSDRITGAFVMGIIRPVIYLPSGLSDREREYILRHEKTHIQRKDYLVRLAGVIMLTIHWFNPMAYISFRLMCRDMEMSCDEWVVSGLLEEERKEYSAALLNAAERESGFRSLLAFGESNTRVRIENVLSCRKLGKWAKGILTVSVALMILGLFTSPDKPAGARAISIIGGSDGPTSIFIAGKIGGGQGEAKEKAGEETEEETEKETDESTR